MSVRADLPSRSAATRSWAWACAAALAFSGCATMSTEREAALGRQQAALVAEQMGLVDDPELARYVSELGDRVAKHAERRDVAYRFHVVDVEVPNAFALPGGYIYVSRGLLVLTNDETELAGVLGHEIGHVAKRHLAKRESRTKGVGALAGIGQAAAGVLGGSRAVQAVQVEAASNIQSYARENEREADAVGQQLMAKAGYDPARLPVFLRRLGKKVELMTGEAQVPSFLDSHPVTSERVRTTTLRAPTLEVTGTTPLSPTRAAYLARLMGLAIGPDPSRGLFHGRHFLQPAHGFALALPAGWATGSDGDAVGAVEPSGQAMVVFELQKGNRNPKNAAESFARGNRLELHSTQVTAIDSRTAYRAKARTSDSIALDLTWISHGGGTYRVVGLSETRTASTYASTFEHVARSFRRPSERELSAIRVRQLYVVRARPGETLAELGERAGNTWSVQETATLNSLSADRPLRAGDLVKIAVERPYRP
jgi:predicted Zn-dependent protease